MNIEFTNPPVNEVVIATYFTQPIADLKSQHVGLFWQRIGNLFPVAHQQLPVGIGADIVPGEPFPMPRYWFISDDDINLVQIQKNAFMLNWRRRGDNKYPYFNKSIKPAFARLYSEFESFLARDVSTPDVSIDICELTYVNIIEQCDYWAGPRDTAKVIPSFAAVHLGAEDLECSGFNCIYTYSVEPNLHLGITVRSVVTSPPPNKPVLVFEIKASARLGGTQKSEAFLWFERAHRTVFNCFVKMTHKRVQYDYWGRQETGEE